MGCDKGQMFIELAVGIGIISLTLVAVVFLSTVSTKTSRVAGDRNRATILAEKTLESVRKMRSDDPIAFFDTAYNAWKYPNCNSPDGVYTCSIAYSYSGFPVNEAKVTVTVTWNEGNSTSKVDLTTYLDNNK